MELTIANPDASATKMAPITSQLHDSFGTTSEKSREVTADELVASSKTWACNYYTADPKGKAESTELTFAPATTEFVTRTDKDKKTFLQFFKKNGYWLSEEKNKGDPTVTDTIYVRGVAGDDGKIKTLLIERSQTYVTGAARFDGDVPTYADASQILLGMLTCMPKPEEPAK